MKFWIYRVVNGEELRYDIFNEEPGEYIKPTLDEEGYQFIETVDKNDRDIITVDGMEKKIYFEKDIETYYLLDV